MALFRSWKNNGVTAVMTEANYLAMLEWVKGLSLKDTLSVQDFRPVFTFSDVPHLRSWVTGTNEDMHRLLVGHELVSSPAVYVPFSNGREVSRQWRKDEPMEVQNERLFHTTIGEAIDAFVLARVLA